MKARGYDPERYDFLHPDLLALDEAATSKLQEGAVEEQAEATFGVDGGWQEQRGHGRS